jgi:hypothetical protein
VAADVRRRAALERERLVVLGSVARAEAERRLLVPDELPAERRERGRVERAARVEVGDRELDMVDRHPAGG